MLSRGHVTEGCVPGIAWEQQRIAILYHVGRRYLGDRGRVSGAYP